MITVKASEFKAKCLKMIDQVAASGEGIVITKHGKPMARLVPEQVKRDPKEAFGALKGWITLPPEKEWEKIKRGYWKESEKEMKKEWDTFFPLPPKRPKKHKA